MTVACRADLVRLQHTRVRRDLRRIDDATGIGGAEWTATLRRLNGALSACGCTLGAVAAGTALAVIAGLAWAQGVPRNPWAIAGAVGLFLAAGLGGKLAGLALAHRVARAAAARLLRLYDAADGAGDGADAGDHHAAERRVRHAG